MRLILLVSMIFSSVAIASSNMSIENQSVNEQSVQKMSPWPRITVYPTNVDLWINNYDERDYNCSGMIYMYLESGRTQTEFYSRRVFARSHDYRSFRNYNYNDRIRSASHTINCF